MASSLLKSDIFDPIMTSGMFELAEHCPESADVLDRFELDDEVYLLKDLLMLTGLNINII